jgi:rod shape-determining protein MreB and related proteins
MFNFGARDIAIDLGTANTLIYEKGVGVVLNEPSYVAMRREAGKRIPFAFGAEARVMMGKTPPDVEVIRPIREGVIADFETAGVMLRHFVSRIFKGSMRFSKPRIIIGVPSTITELEKRMIRESVEGIARQVLLVDEAMAAAIGSGLPVTEPQGSMIVDIGGGTTDIAVMSTSDIVCSRSIRQGGDAIDDAIVNYVRRTHHMLIGEATAERVKKTVGAACDSGRNISIEVRGRSLITGAPASLIITSEEVKDAMGEVIDSITLAIREALENTPPELSGDIISSGIMLAGGGALIEGLARRVQRELRLPITIAADPLNAVVDGAGMCLDDQAKYQRVLF